MNGWPLAVCRPDYIGWRSLQCWAKCLGRSSDGYASKPVGDKQQGDDELECHYVCKFRLCRLST
jgi:hypothetical protein